MKNQMIKSTGMILTLISLSIPLAAAHESAEQSHGFKIEKIDSNSGSPTDIHVKKTKDGVVVSGKIERKIHNKMKIRGHADVDILDEKGKIIEHTTSRLSSTSEKASRNRFSNFKASLSLPSTENFTVRITHAMSELDHNI